MFRRAEHIDAAPGRPPEGLTRPMGAPMAFRLAGRLIRDVVEQIEQDGCIDRVPQAVISREDVARTYQLVLGRPPESEQVVDDLVGHTLSFLLAAFFEGPEFERNVRRPLARLTPPAGGFFDDPPTGDLLSWAAAKLPLGAEGAAGLTAVG